MASHWELHCKGWPHIGSCTVQGCHTLGVTLYRVTSNMESYYTGWPHIGSCTVQSGHTLGFALYRMASHGELYCTGWPDTWRVVLYVLATHMESYCTVENEPSRGSVDEIQSQLLVLTRQGAVLVLQGSVLLQVKSCTVSSPAYSSFIEKRL